MKRLALAIVIGGMLAAPAGADDTASPPAEVAGPDRVVAIATGAKVGAALLVGPSGQVYEPDGKGRWVRTREGGVAADVAGAALVGGALVVAGLATPLYRRDAAAWFTLQLGSSGRTVMGRGPAPAIAVGKEVFVHAAGKWTRVGALPARATAVWASGPKTVWAATDSGLYKLRGKAFVQDGGAPRALVGAVPWAITDAGLRDLTRNRAVPGELDGTKVGVVGAASAGTGALHVICETGAGTLVLATAGATRLSRLDDLPVTGRVAAVAVGSDGEVLVALADGTIAVRTGDRWTTSKVEDDLPTGRTGSPPARTR